MPSPVAPIAQAIAEGFKLLKTVMDTAESRKMKAAIEAAEKYIQVNTKTGQYEKIDDKIQKQYLTHFSKRFFKYNN
jgi:hypothetical protein